MTHAKNIDLHTLQSFDMLVRERSVSRAAERLGVSQPAMSDMLARLRERFHDPLLVRGRAGMQPTPKAELLLPLVREAMNRLHRLDEGGPLFDPAACAQRFRIATSDYTQLLLLPELVAAMAQRAPDAAVDVLPVHLPRVEAALESGEVDLAAAYFLDPPAGLRRSPLFTEHHVLVCRRGRQDVDAGMGAADFARLAHVAVAPSGLTTFSSGVDDALGRLGLARKISASSPHFLLAAYLVSTSDLVLVLPSRAAARLTGMFELQSQALPFATEASDLSLYWHERTHDSAAHRWFREQVKEALSAQA